MASSPAGNLKAAPVPICPNCEGELAGVSIYMWQMENWLVISPYCPHCRVVLHTQVVPFVPGAGVVEGEASRLVRPS
jgi:hypothetical protein